MIRYRVPRRILVRTLLCLLLVFASGCPVLTRSQVDEIKTFGTAAQGYRSLPADVINAYADIRFAREILSTSTTTQADEYLKGVNRAIDFRDKFRTKAQQANDALAVLDVYADALLTLTSDQPTDALTKSATDSGKALDRLVTEYNKKYKTNFGMVGKTAAEIIRGVGGIYIRHKQAELLRHYVTEADPIVQQLTKDVDGLIGVFQGPKDTSTDDVNSLAFEKDQYEQLVVGSARLQPGMLPLSTSMTMAETLEKIQTTTELAQSVPKASQAYRDAHARLKSVVQTRGTLKEDFDEIITLVNEIKAAQSIRKRLTQ